MFNIILLLALIAIAAGFGVPPMVWPGNGAYPSRGGVSSAPAPTPAPAAKSAISNPFARKGKDMTWGGRPDPAPEAYVEEGSNWLGAKWRFGKGKK